jgi:hypothetical protein
VLTKSLQRGKSPKKITFEEVIPTGILSGFKAMAGLVVTANQGVFDCPTGVENGMIQHGAEPYSVMLGPTPL